MSLQEPRAVVVPLEPRRGPVTALWVALRPRQWTKNLLLFAGIVFAAELDDASRWARALTAFAVYCAASSAAYLLNDLRDADADRLHPVKRRRPLARGELSARTALVAARPAGRGRPGRGGAARVVRARLLARVPRAPGRLHAPPEAARAHRRDGDLRPLRRSALPRERTPSTCRSRPGCSSAPRCSRSSSRSASGVASSCSSATTNAGPSRARGLLARRSSTSSSASSPRRRSSRTRSTRSRRTRRRRSP